MKLNQFVKTDDKIYLILYGTFDDIQTQSSFNII